LPLQEELSKRLIEMPDKTIVLPQGFSKKM
jgi:hypothetical protein